MLKILHLAPINFAGAPYSFYDMHNKCGDHSRLITYHKNQRNFPEDVCLNLPLPEFSLAKYWRREKVIHREKVKTNLSPYFKPKNIFEKFYFNTYDFYKKNKVLSLVDQLKLEEYEIIHYDSGLDFFRNSMLAKKWKKQGKKIVCCYYGSDLRIRGIIKEMEEISDLNITSEYDHLAIKPELKYLFYPYDPSELPTKKVTENETITIVHSPTNRKFKGTELIISVIDKLKSQRKINFLLLENMDRNEVLAIKSKSDICIDQVGGTMGGTGYGKAGLETLAMGIPTITNMTEEYEKWLPENPFVVTNNAEELYKKLVELIESKNLRQEYGEKGKLWVRKYHGYESVNEKLKELYKQNKII
ncbi:MAG: glycosyltransferase family 1 protein [Ignavibacteriaceae bacterium]|nr:glycosyltransferase family 1 protein [Ignavibacteriaceae bacterium]